MNLFQRNLFVPMTSLNQQMVIPTCRRISSRLQCYLLMYFKKNDKKKTSCFFDLFLLYILTIFFFHSQCLDISSALTFHFREKLQLKEMFSHLINRMIIEFFWSNPMKIALAQSVVCDFFHLVESGFSSQTLTGPLKKLKSFRLFFAH